MQQEHRQRSEGVGPECAPGVHTRWIDTERRASSRQQALSPAVGLAGGGLQCWPRQPVLPVSLATHRVVGVHVEHGAGQCLGHVCRRRRGRARAVGVRGHHSAARRGRRAHGAHRLPHEPCSSGSGSQEAVKHGQGTVARGQLPLPCRACRAATTEWTSTAGCLRGVTPVQ